MPLAVSPSPSPSRRGHLTSLAVSPSPSRRRRQVIRKHVSFSKTTFLEGKHMLYIAKLEFSLEKHCFINQNVAFSRHKGGEASRTHSPAEAPLRGGLPSVTLGYVGLPWSIVFRIRGYLGLTIFMFFSSVFPEGFCEVFLLRSGGFGSHFGNNF